MELSEFSELFGVNCRNCVKILNILTILKMVGGGGGGKARFLKARGKNPHENDARTKNQVSVTKFAHENIHI